jgi:hypothetical protein
MPIDLELRITLEADGRTLAFELNSSLPELALYRASVGRIMLSTSPQQQLDARFADLSQLARQRAARYSALEQHEVMAHLARIGQRLYRDLFPEPLKQAYRQIRRIQRAAPLTLLIASDEPWIPWELVKPFEQIDATGELIDDPFLCERFYLTRWFAGSALSQAREIAALALVTAGANLAYADDEAGYFTALAARAPEITLRTRLSDAAAVRTALKQSAAQLWHFACHGAFAGDQPDSAAVMLADGQLRAEDIVGPIELGVAQAQPLVFLNACHTGRQGFALTGLGGWAWQFVRARASAFVGAQWEAHDELAAVFAIAFYEALWSGQPLGQALHTARMTTKARDQTNPTWLAYAAYGDPRLRLWLRGQTGPSSAAAEPTPALRALPPVERTSSVSPPPVAPPAVEAGDDEFLYDAFISYRDDEPDRSWVAQLLVPLLDAAGLRICFDQRDFDPGAPPLDQTMHAIERSRRTIAVLSNTYLQDNFAHTENLMAQTLGVEEGRYRLLPLRFEPGCQIPLRLRIYTWLDVADLERNQRTLERLIKAVRTLPGR